MINQTTGKYLILTGITLLVIGISLYFFYDKLGWIGKLPGDIRIENENSSVYIPFTTLLLLSVVVNLLLYLVRKFS